MSISMTSGGWGRRCTARSVSLIALPKFVTTISAPCSWARRAAEKAIESSVVMPVTSSFFPSSNMSCSFPQNP